jgi:hypothetical protein
MSIKWMVACTCSRCEEITYCSVNNEFIDYSFHHTVRKTV